MGESFSRGPPTAPTERKTHIVLVERSNKLQFNVAISRVLSSKYKSPEACCRGLPFTSLNGLSQVIRRVPLGFGV